MSKVVDRTGKRYGRLIAIEIADVPATRWCKIHWRCICDCGTTCVVSSSSLSCGNTNSCGCLHREAVMRSGKSRRLPGDQAARNQALNAYKKGARTRGLSWLLTETEFQKLIDDVCAYCGGPPSNLIRKAYSEPFYYNGIDRQDSGRGYENGNVVTCCKLCNRAKMDSSVEEFEAWISRLFEWRANKPDRSPLYV